MNPSPNNIPYKNEHYSVHIGQSPFIWCGGETDHFQPLLYILVNNATGVIEGETRLLAQAIDWCKTMAQTLSKTLLDLGTTSLVDAVEAIPDGPNI